MKKVDQPGSVVAMQFLFKPLPRRTHIMTALLAVLVISAALTVAVKIQRSFASAQQVTPYAWLEETQIIAHALGGIDDKKYTNSREALEHNYAKGTRVFEADMRFTKDDKLVITHHWEREYPYDKKNPAKKLSYDEFMSAPIEGRFTAMDISDLLAFMDTHPDMYLVTDVKEKRKQAYKMLVKEAKRINPAILDRLIIQLYNPEELAMVRRIFPTQDLIFTLYKTNETDEEVVRFAQENDIRVITMHTQRYSTEFVAALNTVGIRSYVYTINNKKNAQRYRDAGVHGLYSDFLFQGVFDEKNAQ